MSEIMNVYSTIIAAVEATASDVALDYAELSNFKHLLEASPQENSIKYRLTSNIEDAILGNVFQGRRTIAIGSVKSVKNIALKKLPCVIIDTDGQPINYALNIYPESMQELYDDIICSVKLSEDKKNNLPIVIHLDNSLKSTREQLETMTKKTVENFIGELKMDKPEKLIKSALEDNLESLAILHKSSLNVHKLFESISDLWKKRTKRSFVTEEKYMTDGAEYLLLSYGPVSSNLKLTVKKLRETGEKIGLIRVHLFNPISDLSAVSNVKRVFVVDTVFLVGSHGILYHEVHDLNKNSTNIVTEMASVDELVKCYQHAKSSEKTENIWTI